MKVTRRAFVAGIVAASAAPIGVVAAAELGAVVIGETSRLKSDLRYLHALRTKAYRAFVMEGRIDGIVHLRREALQRLGRSLGFEARTDAERRLFRDAAAFLAKLENSAVWLTWDRKGRERCALLREMGEAGGQRRLSEVRRMQSAPRHDFGPEAAT
jgi:hypothetical protein